MLLISTTGHGWFVSIVNGRWLSANGGAAGGSLVNGRWVRTASGTAGGSLELSVIVVKMW